MPPCLGCRGCEVHLVDGTYELFRHHFGVPSHLDPDGMEVAAVRGVLGSVLMMLEQGATHVGVATDHVIESFRNDLWAGYKTSEGMPPELLAQFPLLEEALDALGVAVWPMVDVEADDALASAAARRHATDDRVDRVSDLHPRQGPRPVRRRPVVRAARPAQATRSLDEAAVRERFGVAPASIPALPRAGGRQRRRVPRAPGLGREVGGHGARPLRAPSTPSPTTRTSWERDRTGRAPSSPRRWPPRREAAALFLDLATLRTDAAVGDVDEWEWRGPAAELGAVAERLGARDALGRAERLAARRV